MAEDVNPADLEIADELIAERRAEKPGETPEDMTPWQRPITAFIDVLNYRAGQIIALLLVPMIAVVVYEVFSRNAFAIMADNGLEDMARSLGLGPTLWVYDTSRREPRPMPGASAMRSSKGSGAFMPVIKTPT